MKTKWKRKVDNKMRCYGETDYQKKLIRVNKKKSKKAGKGEVLDTIVHEETHRKHPKMYERTVKRKTASLIKRMGVRQKSKHYRKYS